MSVRPFQAVLDAYRDDVYRFLVASVGPQHADDCFQETFLSALRAYGRLRHEENLRGWLFTIAHRKAIDHHRAARRTIPVADPEPRPSHANGEPEIWELVRTLPPKQRGAVLHRYLNDLSYAEIGKLLRCSEEAARQNAREGLKKLRKAMA